MWARIEDRLEETLLALLLSTMTIISFVQVILRYVFSTGLLWALEATTYMFAWMVMLGMSYGIKKGSHIGVEVLVQRLSRGGRRIAGILAGLMCIAYAAILLIGSIDYTDTMRTLGIEAEDIPIERWILVLGLPIGYALLLLRVVQATWRVLFGRTEGFHLADEAKDTLDQFREMSEEGDAGGRS